MGPQEYLLLFGASARAAAFSALRARLRPWCADLFADADLHAACPALAISANDYPQRFLSAAAAGPPGPWMYTGGLENCPALVDALTRLRPLWGNGGDVLRRVRSPSALAAQLRAAGLPCPRVRTDPARGSPGRWLLKPRDGTGGRGIAFFTGTVPAGRSRCYLQEYVEGLPCAAVYVGRDGRAVLLGVTRQLVGEPWLHAGAFHYCGSVGPLALTPDTLQRFRRLGDCLAEAFHLRGLFGVDCVLRDGVPWPVEVNPRYTASVEILEHAMGGAALAWHRAVFDPAAPPSPPAPPPIVATFGKAVLFAQNALVFPAEGPWVMVLRQPPALAALPAFADVPPAGQHIAKGRPVLTLFARGDSERDCLERLRQTAADLDRRLSGS